MDITILLETLIKLAFLIISVAIVNVFRKIGRSDDLVTAMKISDEIAKIASTVVKAANELEITGALVEKGQTKADYAMEQVKKKLENRGITFDEEQVLNYIKAAVTELRVEISGTNAEKK